MLFSLRSLPAVAVVLVALLSGGCKKDELSAADKAAIEARKKTDDEAIQAYITAQNLTATRTASGLYYVVETPAPVGAPAPAAGKVLTLHYRGYVLNGTRNGTKFDSSYDRTEPFVYTVGGLSLIAGWVEGVGMMHKGERARLIMPSYLGYGTASTGDIPANSVLIFYMDLLNVQ